MFVDHYAPEDVFARVPEVAEQADPVLKALDALLEDDQLYQQVQADLGKRYRLTLVHGRRSTLSGSAPADASLQAPVQMGLSGNA